MRANGTRVKMTRTYEIVHVHRSSVVEIRFSLFLKKNFYSNSPLPSPNVVYTIILFKMQNKLIPHENLEKISDKY
jgi:hypothetical protein